MPKKTNNPRDGLQENVRQTRVTRSPREILELANKSGNSDRASSQGEALDGEAEDGSRSKDFGLHS
jgi:hypothetical protein